MKDEKFYTLRGYSLIDKTLVSTAMEDYLEMICRLIKKGEYARVSNLANLLNVTPSSVSKMVIKLKELDLIKFEPYGIIELTHKGNELGEYLLYRHDVLNKFFCLINKSNSELELVEKIEHFFDTRTIKNIDALNQLECLNEYLKNNTKTYP